jgi:anti-sigma-K factor RskA
VENEASLPDFRESAAPASRKLVAMPSAAARKTEQADSAARAPHAFPASARPDLARPYSARSFSWLPWVLAAACLVLAAGMGIDNRGLRGRLQQSTRTSQQLEARANRANDVMAVLTAPTAQRVTLTAGQAPPQPTGRANYLRERGQLIFTANNLAALPQGKIYELWLIPVSGAPIPAGTFAPDTQGSASVVFPQIPVGVEAKAFGVTVEPAGGSSAPTSAILLQGT